MYNMYSYMYNMYINSNYLLLCIVFDFENFPMSIISNERKVYPLKVNIVHLNH